MPKPGPIIRANISKFINRQDLKTAVAAYNRGYVESELKRDAIPKSMLDLYYQFVDFINHSRYWKEFLLSNYCKNLQARQKAAQRFLAGKKSKGKKEMYDAVTTWFKTKSLKAAFEKVRSESERFDLMFNMLSDEDTEVMIEKNTNEEERKKLSELFTLAELFYEFEVMLEVFADSKEQESPDKSH